MKDMLARLPCIASGKGKDLRGIPGYPDLSLLVFRDSLSTNNVRHLTPVPRKGEIILAQTLFMYLSCLDGILTHIEHFGRDIYSVLPSGTPHDLHRRALVVRRLPPPRVEFVLRRYNTGSLAKALRDTGTNPYGLALPADLPLMQRFAEPVFTPTEKSASDDPLLASDIERLLPEETALARRVFRRAEVYLQNRGLLLLDAKLELSDGVLIDDWLNGDCARIARAEDVRQGEEPPFLDKERFRQIALRKWGDGPKVPLAFTLEELEEGFAGYLEAFTAIAGQSLDEFQAAVLDV